MKKTGTTNSLIFKFSVIIMTFTVVLLVISGILTYLSQMRIYKEQCEENIRNIGEYLAALMENEGENIKRYQDYYMEHYGEMDIPYDFTECSEAYVEYMTRFAAEYPGKTLGYDIDLDDVSEEIKRAYFTFTHEYWLLTFEKAREAFSIPYSYYLVMDDVNYDVVYMIDGERTTPNDHLKDGETPDPADDNKLYLGDRYHNDPDDYAIMWNTWRTGQKQNGYKEFNNSWGHTYCYYTPVNINGETLGIIGTEINVSKVNHEILRDTLALQLRLALVFLFAVFIMVMFLNHVILRRARILEKDVTRYAETKDDSVADDIIRVFKGSDEMDSLGKSFAAMIKDLREHMNKLAQASHDLALSQQYAAEMDDLANKDAMTGVRNKLAYNKEVQRLERNRKAGEVQFGIGVADIDNLKKINDTWGHDKGDEAIKKLCRILCEIFAHSAVFRIGGDEFAIIMGKSDSDFVESHISEFNRRIRELTSNDSLEEWQKVSAAIGYAIYDPATDSSVDDVFIKADRNMYEDKKRRKTARSV